MNIVLAHYYKTVTSESLPGDIDVSEPLALRRLYDLTHGSTLKLSGVHPDTLVKVSAQIEELGGREAAQTKLSAADPWLRAWVDGERQGIIMAQHALLTQRKEALFEKASGVASSDYFDFGPVLRIMKSSQDTKEYLVAGTNRLRGGKRARLKHTENVRLNRDWKPGTDTSKLTEKELEAQGGAKVKARDRNAGKSF